MTMKQRATDQAHLRFGPVSYTRGARNGGVTEYVTGVPVSGNVLLLSSEHSGFAYHEYLEALGLPCTLESLALRAISDRYLMLLTRRESSEFRPPLIGKLERAGIRLGTELFAPLEYWEVGRPMRLWAFKRDGACAGIARALFDSWGWEMGNEDLRRALPQWLSVAERLHSESIAAPTATS